MNLSDHELLQALDRIAATPDGELLYLYFQRVLCSLPVDPEASALHRDFGRRSLAAELMARMGRGIETSGGREHTGTGQRTERAVVFRTGAVDTGRVRSARDFLRATDPEYASIAAAERAKPGG